MNYASKESVITTAALIAVGIAVCAYAKFNRDLNKSYEYMRTHGPESLSPEALDVFTGEHARRLDKKYFSK